MASRNPPPEGARARLRRAISTGGPPLLAFLAGQHHALHMLVLTAGLGAAGASFLSVYPGVRAAMLGVSLAIAGWMVWQARRPDSPREVRISRALSAGLTLVLVVWSALSAVPP